MERFEFYNKIWVSEKGRFLNKVLWVCGWLLLVLNLVMFIMEGSAAVSGVTLIFIILMLVWSRSSMGSNGRYIESLCILTFTENKLIWEMPELEIRSKKDAVSMKYTLETEDVIGVQISNEMKSIRIACTPLIETQTQNGEVKVKDCRRKQDPHDLILYYEDIKYVENLIQKYLGVEIDIFD